MYTAGEQEVLKQAATILKSKLTGRSLLDITSAVKSYCKFSYAHLEHEIFALLLLDGEGKLIETIVLFRGSIDHVDVPPREVIKESLKHNAKLVIAVHNHPSGSLLPTKQDKAITTFLETTLKLVDIELVDHIIVSSRGCFSFYEHGLIKLPSVDV